MRGCLIWLICAQSGGMDDTDIGAGGWTMTSCGQAWATSMN
ncbi:hypothetical protein [Ferrovum sp.]|nr:hypothetical protein [Ferrovum sp.]